MLSDIVSQISRIIGPIFDVDGVSVFNGLIWGEPLKSGLRNLARKIRNILYRTV